MNKRRFIEAVDAYFKLHGIEAPFPKHLLLPILPKSAVIVDAGAHVGIDTVEFAKCFPSGRILAFEPEPHLFDQLRTNISGLQNIEAARLALSDKPGVVEFYVSSGTSDAASSIMHPKEILAIHPGNAFDRVIKVDAVRLDDYLKSKGWSHVDMLWLDLQGAEFQVLKTMTAYLPRVKAIFLEVSLIEVYEHVPLYGEVKFFLEESGFEIVFEQLPWRDSGNVLALNRNLGKLG